MFKIILCFIFVSTISAEEFKQDSVSALQESTKKAVSLNLGLDYIYDSNVPQNFTETAGDYLVPFLDIKVLPFTKVPVYLDAQWRMDSYVKERQYKDHSPFIQGALGLELGQKWHYQLQLQGEYYLGFAVYNPAHLEDEPQNGVWVERIHSIQNNFSF